MSKLAQMSGPESAAILLLSLGQQDAASILKQLDPREIEVVGAEMARLALVPSERAESVIDKFLARAASGEVFGGDPRNYMKNILVAAFGEQRAETMLDRMMSGGGGGGSGIEALQAMEPRAIAQMFVDEHPQITAALMAQLDGQIAAKVVPLLPPRLRTDVLMRIAKLDKLPQAALAELDRIVADRVANGPRAVSRKIGGTGTVADIVNALDQENSETILGDIETRDAEMHTEIKDLLFVFDDLVDVDDKGVQMILREVSSGILATALRGASPPVAAKIYRNMSKRAAEILKEDMEARGPIRVSEVEAAQREILSVTQKLAADGVIVIGRNAAEYL
jgi:flagellar motor switch protein FliG